MHLIAVISCALPNEELRITLAFYDSLATQFTAIVMYLRDLATI
jgi:hypothetical protein